MRIAIIGKLANEEEFDASRYDEVWGMNLVLHPWVKKWTHRFQLHAYQHLEKNWSGGLKQLSEWLHQHKEVPLYTLDRWPDEVAPNQRIFPRQKLEEFPRANYHCCTVDWLIAFAIHLNATAIGLHGVSSDICSDQPLSARACIEYWSGFAAGRGIRMISAADCGLFCYLHLVRSNTVYGYDDTDLFEDRRR